MLGRKMKPIVFSAEEGKEIQKQLGVQEVNKTAPKSTDPINFPVWEVPVNKRVLCYVPNHTYVDDNGVEHLKMDKAYIHSVTVNGRYYNYRCISGLESESNGLTGECPLCDGCNDPWDLANLRIEARCKQAGLDPDDRENQAVKNIRSAEYSDRVLKDATRYFAFPIVVFDTLNDDGKTFIKDENGGYKYKCYWYVISESQYEEKWKKSLDAMEDEPTHPGGHFFLLNYKYSPKHGEPNKRDSARNLQVNVRTIRNSDSTRAFLDEQTAHWTPEKAQQTIIAHQIYSVEDLSCLADEVLESTRNLIAVMKSPVPTDSLEGGDGFKLEQKPEVPSDDGGNSIPLDDTDDDYDMAE